MATKEQKRRFKAREIHLSVPDFPTIKLVEINNVTINIPHNIGAEVGLSRNFLYPWHLGIIEIEVSGFSYIGAFLGGESETGDNEVGDGADENIIDLKARMAAFEQLARDRNRMSILWIIDDAKVPATEYYVGHLGNLKFTETSDNPYIISYSFNFKSARPAQSRSSIADAAVLEKEDYYLTRAGEKKASVKKEEKDEKRKTDEKKLVEEEVIGGVDDTGSTSKDVAAPSESSVDTLILREQANTQTA